MNIQIGDIVKIRNNLNEYIVINIITPTDIRTINKLGETFIINEKAIIAVKRPCQYKTIYKRKEILTEEEKEYLRAVIKPFRNQIISITKHEYNYQDEQYILIKSDKNEAYYLPDFASNTIYKGMGLDKEYTLEELGLW